VLCAMRYADIISTLILDPGGGNFGVIGQPFNALIGKASRQETSWTDETVHAGEAPDREPQRF
jgi:hypothetical protein